MDGEPSGPDFRDGLPEEDRAHLPTLEAARAALEEGRHAELLRTLAPVEPTSQELMAWVMDLRIDAALGLRDLLSLESMAGRAEPLGELRPERARHLMLEAEAVGALDLARALARGLAAGGEDVAVIQARLEKGRSPSSLAVKRIGEAAMALGDDHDDFRLIGTGKLSYVVSAVHRETGERRAFKFLAPGIDVTEQARARFERQAEVLRQLDHPGILRLISHSMGDPLYLCTEFFPGASLSTLIAQGRTFDAADVTRLGLDLAAAAAHAHEHGVIHRDIQAANVLRDREGAIKLIDFGMARLTESAGVTAVGSALGDWQHHPPEIFTGSAAEPTLAMDVFGVGVALHEMATGQPPYASVRGFTRIRAADVAELAPALPTELQEVIRRALAEDPAERWPGVEEMRQALERVPA